jgi:hypothetical protein
MKLSDSVLEGLAKMVCSDASHFPYRKGWEFTKISKRCGKIHSNTVGLRTLWEQERLTKLNLGSSQSANRCGTDYLT